MVLQRQEGSDSLRYPASDRRHIRRAGREVGPEFQDWDLKVHKGWNSPDSQPVLEREAEDVSVNCEEGREIVPSVALGRCIPFFSG